MPRRSPSLRLLTSLPALLGFLTPAAAAPNQASAYLDALRLKFGYPGVSAAVSVDGQIAWTHGSGLADVASGTPATPQTIYRIGSVSKLVTAAAVARLLEERKLDLDSPVQRYVPEYPAHASGVVTTRLLAAHASGIPHYQAGDKPDTLRPDYTSVIAAMAEYRDKPLLHAPGTRVVYSTYGYNLISAVVERAAGVPFPDYLDKIVFSPLRMSRSQCERAGQSLPGLATFYELTENSEIAPLKPMFLSYKWAGGGMLSTAEDLVRFGQAWLPGSTVFHEETLALVFTTIKLADGQSSEVGIGWRIDTEPSRGQPVYHHGGTIGGGRAFLAVLPTERTVVAILANLVGKENFGLHEALELLATVRPSSTPPPR